MNIINWFQNFRKKKEDPQKTKLAANADLIKGIDLRIDSDIQEICESYNKSSGSTRAVLYVLLVINVLACIAVINTRKDNWMKSRITSKRDVIVNEELNFSLQTAIYHKEQDSLNSVYKLKAKSNKANVNYDDSLKNALIKLEANFKKEQLAYPAKLGEEIHEIHDLDRNKIENFQTVRLPLLDNSFDINDLALVTGLSFTLLLVVVKFSLSRERNNLRIALESVTERYDCSEKTIDKEIKEDLRHMHSETHADTDDLLEAYNYKRRRYHYNFLSMNEIFNMPKLEISKNTIQQSSLGEFITAHMFSIPFFIYVLILYNDWNTIDAGKAVSSGKQISVWCVFCVVFLNFIALLCRDCNKLKKSINTLFNTFYDETVKDANGVSKEKVKYTIKGEYFEQKDFWESMEDKWRPFLPFFVIIILALYLSIGKNIDYKWRPFVFGIFAVNIVLKMAVDIYYYLRRLVSHNNTA